MRYIPLTVTDQEAMLRKIGVSSVEDLFSTIPDSVKRKSPTPLPKARSESELTQFFKNLSERNQPSDKGGWTSFLGCGAYEHFIPSVVDALSMRGEFATAYTPYQPEVSQGTLQAIFEFQSMVANYFEMDVANASMYDGASSAAEAVLMASRIKEGKKVYVSKGLHPDYLKTIRSYLSDTDVVLSELELDEHGRTTLNTLNDAGAVLVAQPNFYGVIEDLKLLNEKAHAQNALVIVANTEPFAFGVLKAPGAFGTDIFVGEGQGFGNPLSFGGPYVGLFAAKKEFLRQMPGRLVGETTDQSGKRGYVLTLSTREQHIRREKATSNICTNHSLCALRTCIYLSLVGKSGLMEIAKANMNAAHYLADGLVQIKGVSLKYDSAFFNEFTLRLPVSSETFLSRMQEQKIFAGVPLTKWESASTHEIVVAVTETKSKAELDRFIEAAKRVL